MCARLITKAKSWQQFFRNDLTQVVCLCPELASLVKSWLVCEDAASCIGAQQYCAALHDTVEPTFTKTVVDNIILTMPPSMFSDKIVFVDKRCQCFGAPSLLREKSQGFIVNSYHQLFQPALNALIRNLVPVTVWKTWFTLLALGSLPGWWYGVISAHLMRVSPA